MAKLRRFLLWATLVLLIALILFSIYGAFLGAERAQVFFNTIPLAVYWFALFSALVVGILSFKQLLRSPSSLFVHGGCVAILIGGLWGSAAGQKLQNRWLGRDIIPKGHMALVNGQKENKVYLADASDEVRELPFALALDTFRMEFYPGKLHVQDSRSKQTWTFPAQANAVYDLGPPHGQLKIVRAFENFKIGVEKDAEGKSVTRAYDQPGGETNPALEILVGSETKPRYIFERHPGHATPESPLALQYRKGMVRDYISEIEVLQDGEVVTQKDIEVNHPLYYGGYHFYQSSYGQDERSGQMYTVLSVVPRAGLNWVYAGYILLCAGTAWRCWIHSIKKALHTGGSNNGR